MFKLIVTVLLTLLIVVSMVNIALKSNRVDYNKFFKTMMFYGICAILSIVVLSGFVILF